MLYTTFKNNETEIQTGLPKFLDVHSLKDVNDETHAVLKHHEKYGFKCEWLMEIKSTRTN
ncbi:MAG TPA: hypothetical protein VFG90_06240 [Nitrososphaeraceae archaeon]|nr:hypothetical protein [Nitrososphaeraceae archaeon]